MYACYLFASALCECARESARIGVTCADVAERGEFGEREICFVVAAAA